MIRQIIKIDIEKCNGCGLCAKACHEGAIGIVNNKAKLLKDDYCDGMGDCLPNCPMGAISFENREAAPYDEKAVDENKKKKAIKIPFMAVNSCDSCLQNWPVQIKLAPLQAPYYASADLLIAADCTAFSYGSFHKDFIQGKVTLIGCSKLDAVDYSEKLTQIFTLNSISSITIVKMEVPCCNGIVMAVKKALLASDKVIPFNIVTISTKGEILDK